MKKPPFELYKVKRTIQWYGTNFTFYRDALDKFKDKLEYAGEVGTIKGIFHESNSYVNLNTSDGSVTQTEPRPQIFCLYEDAKYIQPKDFLRINGKKYEVTGVSNYNEWNYAADISLRVVYG